MRLRLLYAYHQTRFIGHSFECGPQVCRLSYSHDTRHIRVVKTMFLHTMCPSWSFVVPERLGDAVLVHRSPCSAEEAQLLRRNSLQWRHEQKSGSAGVPGRGRRAREAPQVSSWAVRDIRPPPPGQLVNKATPRRRLPLEGSDSGALWILWTWSCGNKSGVSCLLLL